ncbi:hypothetical protein Pint_29083 [Pistacia integerrima]|uniref:Uncharacterized protein n=1 Tax=Pistacia integerrima TaxID=434235 RepID=A0ACC0X1W6_9ROSI|nr:hypothetical protein Pint_29083 [Pistacia integerrima]
MVAALIITIVFAATFIVPGGNGSAKGTPIFLHKPSFIVRRFFGVLVEEVNHWASHLVLSIASIMFPLLVEMISSTYGSSILQPSDSPEEQQRNTLL